jgi:hypothetical protein
MIETNRIDAPIETEHIVIDDSATLHEVSLRLVEQCVRRLDLASRHLDPAIYDRDDFVGAVKRLALSSRLAQVRLLVTETGPVVSRGHRLIELAMRLTSFIEVRTTGPEHKGFNEAMLIADNTGYVHRRFADRYEGEASFADKRRASDLTTRFEELWERSLPDQNFRRLHI